MLRELRIQNFAIVENQEFVFSDGLTVFTGETGAGKSILVDALELILGGRASLDQIRTARSEAVLEAAFSPLPKHPVMDQLKEMGLIRPDDEEILIRRIISRSGKNRAYLNGGLIPLGLLLKLGTALVDIHSQHEHQSLLRHEDQLEILDAYGGLLPMRSEYKKEYRALVDLRREREELQALYTDRSRLEDLLRHQQHEISSAQLRPGEEEEMERERKLLSHSKRLSALSAEAYESLYETEESVLSHLSKIESLIDDLSEIDPLLKEMNTLFREALANLDEVSRRLRVYRDQVEYDPDRLSEIEDRNHLISQLKKKYGGTEQEVLATLRSIEDELEGIIGRDERLSQIERQLNDQKKKVENLASNLSRGRRRSAEALEKEMRRELKHLRMGGAHFEVRIQSKDLDNGPASNGADEVAFMIAPNPGEEARLLSRIASGGELSRIMLALKVILSDVDVVPSLVFDEVDAGIGGAVADVVGERLQAVSKRRQVFCITHLPQIAARGTFHVVLEKRIDRGRTITRGASLSGRKRVEEIARMLGGREITETALRHAKEMLGGENRK